MMKTINLHSWGSDHPITFRLANYLAHNNLYVGMIVNHDPDFPEHWSDLTVNLDVKCAENCAYIDTNNNGDRIVEWLITNKLATLTGNMRSSGFCVYPEMKFNMRELMQYVVSDRRKEK